MHSEEPIYRHDLATIHHLGYGFHADSCAPGILALLEPIRQRGGLVLEIGCGSGLLTKHLVQAGHRVLATDASPATWTRTPDDEWLSDPWGKNEQMIAKLKTYVIDAPDIAALAAFYGSLAGWTTAYEDDEWITMTTDDGWRIALQAAPDHVPPRWPYPAAPQQAHLDLRVPDINAAAQRAVELGATLLRRNETWHTLADPAGHPFDLCLKAEDPNTTLMGFMLDCPDAKALSAFYSQMLGKPVTYEADGVAMIGEDGQQPVLFQQIEDYRAPRWPDPAFPQQVHLDLLVDPADLELAEQEALAIGATRMPGDGENWRVYADPAGKPFCLTWNE